MASIFARTRQADAAKALEQKRASETALFSQLVSSGGQIDPNQFSTPGVQQLVLNNVQQRTHAQELSLLAQVLQGGGPIDPTRFTNPAVGQLALNQIIQRQQPQPGFTLGPGQTRFGTGGQKIASVAPPPQIETVGQIRAEQIRRLQAIPEDKRTVGQKESLKRLLEGQAAVQISFGKSTAAERTAIAETQASIDALDNLESLFENSFVKTGPIAGRVEFAKGFLDLSSQNQEDLFAAEFAFRNAVIKDITGAQMSEPEAQRIMKQIPASTDAPKRRKAKIEQTRKNLKFIQKRRSEVLKRSGIVSPLDGQTINIRTPESQGASDEEILRILGGQ